MSDGQRLPLDEARHLAADLARLLAPACDGWTVAGSIRREMTTCGDIELVVIPRVRTVTVATDLFGNARQVEQNAFDLLCENLLTEGVLAKRLNKLGRPAWGPDLKWGTFRGFNVDLYSATPGTWAVTLLIRTGDAKYSNCLATPKSRHTHDGHRGLLPDHVQLKGWRYVHRATGEPFDTPTEESVFDLLGIPFVEPTERTPKDRPWTP